MGRERQAGGGRGGAPEAADDGAARQRQWCAAGLARRRTVVAARRIRVEPVGLCRDEAAASLVRMAPGSAALRKMGRTSKVAADMAMSVATIDASIDS